MITDIYYFLSIFVLFNQLKWILSPKLMMIEIVDTLNIIQNSTISKDFNKDFNNDKYKSAMKRLFNSIFIIGWLFLGFFTKQWVIFMFLLIFQFLIINPVSKLVKNHQKTYFFFHWINSIIRFLSISFIVLNQYKLHIDFETPLMILIVKFFQNIF